MDLRGWSPQNVGYIGGWTCAIYLIRPCVNEWIDTCLLFKLKRLSKAIPTPAHSAKFPIDSLHPRLQLPMTCVPLHPTIPPRAPHYTRPLFTRPPPPPNSPTRYFRGASWNPVSTLRVPRSAGSWLRLSAALRPAALCWKAHDFFSARRVKGGLVGGPPETSSCAQPFSPDPRPTRSNIHTYLSVRLTTSVGLRGIARDCLTC